MPNSKRIALGALATVMITMGILHFVVPQPFAKIVPPVFPAHLALVYVSGIFEILGGVGLLVPMTRRLAAWGLIALYVAVFPANVYMALDHVSVAGVTLPAWALWARLPFQLVFIGWAYWFTRPLPGRRQFIGTVGQ